jgi:mRNA interferase YafQ
MRTIEPTRQFRRDYKREKKGQLGPQLDALLEAVIDTLAADQPLAPKHRDHAMTGEYGDCREPGPSTHLPEGRQ